MRIIYLIVLLSILTIGCAEEKKPFKFDDEKFSQWDSAYVFAKKYILLKNDSLKNLVWYQNIDRFKNRGILVGLKYWIKKEMPLDLDRNLRRSSFKQLIVVVHTWHSSRIMTDFIFLILDKNKSLGYNFQLTMKGVEFKSTFPVVNSDVMAYLNQIQDPSELIVPDSTTLLNHQFILSILTKDSIKVYPYEVGNLKVDQLAAFDKLVKKKL